MFTQSNTNAVCLFQLAEYSACSSHSTLSDSTPAIQQSTVHSHLYAQQTLPHATFTHNNQIHTTHNVHSDTHFTLPNTQAYTHDIHSQEVASNKQNLPFFPLFINFFHISFHTVKYICPNLSKICLFFKHLTKFTIFFFFDFSRIFHFSFYAVKNIFSNLSIFQSLQENLTFFTLFNNFIHISFHAVKQICLNLSIFQTLTKFTIFSRFFQNFPFFILRGKNYFPKFLQICPFF